MATFFSNQTVGTWSGYTMTGTLTGNVGRSGNTVTLSSLSCTFKATSAWGTDSGYWSAIYNGNTQLTRSNGLSMSNGTGSKSYSNVSITVGAADTSHQFNFRTSDGKTVYFTVYFPSGQTEPATPTISAVLNADETVSVTWGTTNLGNPTGTVKLYGDTNADPSTELASKSTTGNTTFTHTGLNPGTTYYYKAYASNSVGNKTSSIVSVTTPEHAKLYGSVNGQTKRVKKLYGPIGVVNITNWSLGSQTIVPGFDPTTMTALDDMAGELTADITSIAVTYTASGHKLKADVNLSDGKVIHYITDGPVELLTVVRLARLGCDASIVSGWRANDSYPSTNLSDTVTITSTYTSKSKKIKKLYGSVNGQTKLIYQG